MKKRIVCVLLALVMLVGMLPAAAMTASAASVTTSDAAIKVLKDLEDYKENAYESPENSGNYYVGYGTSCKAGDTMTEEEADAALREELAAIDAKLNAAFSGLSQQKHDALALFSYNCGTSWMSGSSAIKQAVANGAVGQDFLDAICAWSNANGSFSSGLLKRRMLEANIYLNGSYVVPTYTYVTYDANGGKATDDFQVYMAGGDTALASASRDDYIFMGWYNANGALYTSIKNIKAGTTLYANWQDKNLKADAEEHHAVSYTLSKSQLSSLTTYDAPNGKTNGTVETATVKIENDYIDAKGVRWCKISGVGQWVKYGVAATTDTTTKEDTAETALVVTVTNTYINVRSDHSITSTKVGTVNYGDKLTITDVYTGSNGMKWGKFSKGWVALMYTDYDAVIAEVDNSSANSGDVVATALVVCSSTVNVRNAAGMSGTVIGSLSNGTKVNLYAIKTVNGHDWGQISDGWFCLDYATVTKLTEDAGTKEENDPDVIATGTVVGCTTLNVRSAAGVGNALVTSINCGSTVKIYETKTVSGHNWGRISDGWICLDYVSITSNSGSDNSGTSGSTGSDTTASVSFTGKISAEGGATVYKSTSGKTAVAELKKGDAVKVSNLTSKTVQETVAGDNNTDITTTTTTYWAHIAEGWVETKYIALDSLDKEQYQVVNGSLDVRSSAGVSTDPDNKINTLSSGTVVEVSDLQIVGTSVWGKITYASITGYVNLSSSNLTVYVEEDTKDTNDSASAYQTGTVVCSTYLKVRGAAGVGQPQVGQIANGTKVTILSTTTVSGHEWGKIDGGWICLDYVVLDQATTTPGSSDNTTNNSGATGSTGSGTVSNGSYLATGVVTGGVQLTVRSGAGLGFGSVATLNPGTEFTVYERVLSGGMSWGRIDQGWICLSYTLITGTPNTGSGSMGTIGNTYTGVNVRSAAGTGNALLCKILTGSRVEIYEQKLYSGSYWGRTSMGWVCMDYVALDSAVGDNSILDGTGSMGTGSASNNTTTQTTSVSYTGTASDAAAGYVTVYKEAGSTVAATTLSNGAAITLNELTAVTVQDETDPNKEITSYWARINEGWIPASQVALDSLDEVTYTVISDTLNVREAAGIAAEKVGSLDKGDVVAITELEVVKNSVWGLVEEEDGWVCMDSAYLTVGKVNVTTSNTTATENTTNNTTTNNTTSNTTGTTATGTALYNGTIIGTDKVNVRTIPSTAENTLAGSLKKGTSVKIYELAVAEYMAWGRTASGWVSLVYVDLVPTNAAAIDARVVQVEGTNIRASASATAEPVGTYAKNTVIDIYEFSGNWARTDAGWVHTDNLLY